MRRFLAYVLLLVLSILASGGALVAAQTDSVNWWLAGPGAKVLYDDPAPDSLTQVLQLHAGRGEYAPFQVVFESTSGQAAIEGISITHSQEYFQVTLYEEVYLPLLHTPEPEIFSLSRMSDAKAVPDGLKPLHGSLSIPADGKAVVWVDLLVRAGTPPGEYSFTVAVPGQGAREVVLAVYSVNLVPLPSMSVIIPLEVGWTVPHYATGDPGVFQQQVNRLLLEHSLVPGSMLGQPRQTEIGWDFSALDEEMRTLPRGASFYAPIPYDERTHQYLINDESGQPYQTARFDDPHFVAQVDQFFQALADYLGSNGRADSALVYPVDESRWVADEPIHGGPDGYVRLAQWTASIRRAGLRVSASGVPPVPLGPTTLGWLNSADVTDDSHVHVDVFDGAPVVFAEWLAQSGKSASLYLNEYGDLIDLPSSVNRGLLWHAYAGGTRTVAGYAALEWVDESYELVDPWKHPELIYPVSGYGGGALIWPGPLPSIRLKVLREGVEDARLLDLYARTTSKEEARAFAALLAGNPLADQHPAPDLWDEAHRALLIAVADRQHVVTSELPVPPAFEPQEVRIVLDMDDSGADFDSWDFEQSAGQLVDSPWPKRGDALQVDFNGGLPTAGFWLGSDDWSEWQALQISVENPGAYFLSLDVGLGDRDSNYLLLRGGAILVGPGERVVLTLPLVAPIDYAESFDWTRIRYLNFEVATETTQTNGFGVEATYPLGPRTLIFDDVRLVR